MAITVICIILSVIIFFYHLFSLGREDYILIRRNISPENVFNIAIVTVLLSVYAGRVGYVLFHMSSRFLNPWVFFLIPYFPGVSFLGCLIGGFVLTWYIAKLKKVPSFRLLDFFTYSLLSALPLCFLAYFFANGNKQPVIYLSEAVIYLIVFLLFRSGILPKFHRGDIKEGSITGLFFATYSCVTLFFTFLQLKTFSVQTAVYLGILFVVFLAAIFTLWQRIFAARK